MLTAIRDGERVISFEDDGKGEYIDPVFGKKMMYVRESVTGRIPHFRSWSGELGYGEPESIRHMRTKLYVYNLLKDKGAILEKPIGNHVPDVVIDDVAIEVQCSPMGSNEFWDRMVTYTENGYYTIWFFDKDTCLKERSRWKGKNFLKKYARNFYSINCGLVYSFEDIEKLSNGIRKKKNVYNKDFSKDDRPRIDLLVAQIGGYYRDTFLRKVKYNPEVIKELIILEEV